MNENPTFWILGKYAVLSSYSSKTGKITSPVLPRHPNTGKCLTFYYQLNGISFPEHPLSVYTEDSAKRYVNYPTINDQGNYWRRKAFTIPPKEISYRVKKIRLYAYLPDVGNKTFDDDLFYDLKDVTMTTSKICFVWI